MQEESKLDWKPNAHKCRDRESKPGLIGAKRGIRCADLLPQLLWSLKMNCGQGSNQDPRDLESNAQPFWSIAD